MVPLRTHFDSSGRRTSVFLQRRHVSCEAYPSKRMILEGIKQLVVISSMQKEYNLLSLGKLRPGQETQRPRGKRFPHFTVFFFGRAGVR